MDEQRRVMITIVARQRINTRVFVCFFDGGERHVVTTSHVQRVVGRGLLDVRSVGLLLLLLRLAEIVRRDRSCRRGHHRRRCLVLQVLQLVVFVRQQDLHFTQRQVQVVHLLRLQTR